MADQLQALKISVNENCDIVIDQEKTACISSTKQVEILDRSADEM